MTLGTDFSGGRDLNPAMLEVGDERALGEALIRRLTTDIGSLIDHPDYGYNLADFIGSASVDAEAVREGVLEQCFAEEEVDDADCEVHHDGLRLVVTIRVESGSGPFTLTFTVDELVVTNIIPEV